MNEHATNTTNTSSGASGRSFVGESGAHANIAPRGLWNRGFVSLLFTQFFEAASDNIIKGVLTFAVAVGAPWETVFGKGGNGLVGVAFTLPFILLSAFGGRIADRSSKSRITIILKMISLAVAALTAFEFARGSAWGAQPHSSSLCPSAPAYVHRPARRSVGIAHWA